MQRFLTIMSVFFFVCGVVSLWRILSDDGRDIWYVPLVLIGASGILAVRARSMGRKNTKTKTDMKTNVMQIVRLVMMIVAVAGIIYALEYMERGIAVWFWITLLGVGFVGLLYTFRLTQRRVRLERRARERQEKKNSRRSKR